MNAALPPVSDSRKPWYRSSHHVAAMLGLSLLLLIVALIGIELDADGWRAPLARMMSSQCGRAVSIEGSVSLRVGLRPQLRVHGLHIAQPAGAHDDFLSVGDMEIRLNLLPLLIGRIQAERLAARDVRLSLRQNDDGSNNWTFGQAQSSQQSSDDLSAHDLAGIDIRQLDLDDIRVLYQSGTARPIEFQLDRLDAALPIGRGVTLRADGQVERTMPYRLSVDGGELAQLLSGQAGWPLAVRLEFAGGTLAAQGKLGDKDSSIIFGMGAPDLAQFGKVLGVSLPNAGAAALAGTLSFRPGRVRAERLSGTLGKTTMGGWLQYDANGDRPKLTGALAVPTLDLGPFLGQDDQNDPPTDLQALYRSLANATLDLKTLRAWDANIQLGVGQWLSLPGDIQEASLNVVIANGKLDVPVHAVVERVPLQGRLSADGAAAVPSLALSFSASQSPIGGLARFLAGVPGIDGQLGGLRMDVSAKGARGDALMRSLSAMIRLRQSHLSYGNLDGGKPVSFTLDDMQVAIGGDQALSGELKGSLLGRPLTAVLSGPSMRTALEQADAPVVLDVQNGRIAARLSGTLNSGQDSADLTFSLGAERAGDVGAWLGLNPQSTLPIALAGRVRGNLQHWSLSQLVFQVGDSGLYSDLEQTSDERHQRLNAKLDIVSVDLKQLDQLLPAPKPAKSGQKASLDIPILPARLALEDADVSVRARDIRGAQLELGELGFDGRVRDGYMHTSPFFANIAGTRYDGAVMLDLRNAEPRAEFWLSAAPVDVGKAMRQLKLAKNIESTVERLTLYITTRSSQLSTLVANASVIGEIGGGRFTLRDENTKSQLQVALTQGSLSARPGERVALTLSGAVDSLPVEIRLRSASMKSLADAQARIPFELTLNAASTQLQLTGSVDRDIDARDIELALDAHGERLDALDKLLRVSLPPWGPWSAGGRFRMNSRGYAVDDLRLQVGGSKLQGRGAMDTSQGRAKLDIALESPLIQLDDFNVKGWSALDGKRTQNKVDADDKTDLAALRKKAAETSDQVQGVLSREYLAQADASVSVRVAQVKSGKDGLGRGSLDARLAKGRAEIGAVIMSMPDGQATLNLSYEPREKDVLADLKLDIDRFDYGVLGRRLKPDNDLGGRFSVKVDVRSRAPRLSQLLAHGNGRVDVAVWPEKLRAGVFDLWAVNLFVALLPTLDPSNESVINCAVGRFRLNEGKLTHEQLVIDTSRMRVKGSAEVDFQEERVKMRLQPQAKTAQFLSLETPIEVNGKFDQFSVGPNPGDLLQTVARLATSVVWVPIQKLFSAKVPQDGVDVCRVKF
jgi:uncharacterized protein involved in outer membrane biogenesis